MIRAFNSGKEQLWRARLQRFQSSGMSVTRFCQREQISVPSFYQWRKRLGISTVNNATPTFVPVRVTQASMVEIHLPNGTRICVPAGQADSLRLAIEVVGQLGGDQDGEAAC